MLNDLRQRMRDCRARDDLPGHGGLIVTDNKRLGLNLQRGNSQMILKHNSGYANLP